MTNCSVEKYALIRFTIRDKKTEELIKSIKGQIPLRIREFFRQPLSLYVEDHVGGIISKDKLEEFIDVCNDIITHCPLVKDNVVVGSTYEGDKEVPLLKPGERMINAEYIKKIFPDLEDFIFDTDCDYCGDYIHNLENIMGKLKDLIKDMDFNTQDIYYSEVFYNDREDYFYSFIGGY